MILQLNSDALVKYTAKLEKLHRSGLPIAARETLTSGAKHVKTVTMPQTAGMFKKRQPNFFKANSKYEKAEGFNIGTMKATVGFFENKLQKQPTNYAVKDLLQQERGGSIQGRAFIAMKKARSGRGNVRENFRMDNITKASVIVAKGNRSKKQNFIRAVFVAAKKGGYVLGNKDSKGSRTLSKIDGLASIRGTNNLRIARTPLYRVKGNRVVTVKRTDFMKRASNESALNLNRFYIMHAQKQFEKALK